MHKCFAYICPYNIESSVKLFFIIQIVCRQTIICCIVFSRHSRLNAKIGFEYSVLHLLQIQYVYVICRFKTLATSYQFFPALGCLHDYICHLSPAELPSLSWSTLWLCINVNSTTFKLITEGPLL